MKKTIGIILISVFLLSGCAFVAQICSQFLPEEFCRIITCVFGEEGLENLLKDMEARKFLQEHPDAEITMTLIPEKHALKYLNRYGDCTKSRNESICTLATHSLDMILLELKDGRDSMVVIVDANNKQVRYSKINLAETILQPKEIPFVLNVTGMGARVHNEQRETKPPTISDARINNVPIDNTPAVIVPQTRIRNRTINGREWCRYGAMATDNEHEVWERCRAKEEERPPTPPKEKETVVVEPTKKEAMPCHQDADCKQTTEYSHNSEGNPIEITNTYRCKNNKCEVSIISSRTI